MAITYSISKVGLEVYTTAKTEEEDVDSNTQESTETTGDFTDVANNFTLETGEITKINYIGELFSDNFEQDYTDISSNASISVPIKYLNYFYKGRRVALKKAWQRPGATILWEDMDTAILGFINEITWTKDKMDVKIAGMDKLLEKEEQFTFTQTKRSEVIKKIIEAAGLKAKVDATGLVDDVIDFTNVSSSGDSDSSGTGQSTGSASIDQAVENAIKGKKDDLSKAKAIDAAFKEHVIYDYYFDVHHPDLDEAWSNAHLNCADGANVLCAMFIKGGLQAVILHTSGHYIVKVTINGKAYYTDNAASTGSHTTRPFGEVWGDDPSTGSEVGTKIAE